jgi:hypothetical protein
LISFSGDRLPCLGNASCAEVVERLLLLLVLGSQVGDDTDLLGLYPPPGDLELVRDIVGEPLLSSALNADVLPREYAVASADLRRGGHLQGSGSICGSWADFLVGGELGARCVLSMIGSAGSYDIDLPLSSFERRLSRRVPQPGTNPGGAGATST